LFQSFNNEEGIYDKWKSDIKKKYNFTEKQFRSYLAFQIFTSIFLGFGGVYLAGGHEKIDPILKSIKDYVESELISKKSSSTEEGGEKIKEFLKNSSSENSVKKTSSGRQDYWEKLIRGEIKNKSPQNSVGKNNPLLEGYKELEKVSFSNSSEKTETEDLDINKQKKLIKNA
jgi:hypothetical protein